MEIMHYFWHLQPNGFGAGGLKFGVRGFQKFSKIPSFLLHQLKNRADVWLTPLITLRLQIDNFREPKRKKWQRGNRGRHRNSNEPSEAHPWLISWPRGIRSRRSGRPWGSKPSSEIPCTVCFMCIFQMSKFLERRRSKPEPLSLRKRRKRPR